MKNLNYFMDHILYQILKDYFEYIFKKTWRKNRLENRITFKIKTRCYLEFLIPETMKLLGSNKSKITKNENGGNVSHLEITEVVLAYCHIVKNNYQQNSRVLYLFVSNNY